MLQKSRITLVIFQLSFEVHYCTLYSITSSNYHLRCMLILFTVLKSWDVLVYNITNENGNCYIVLAFTIEKWYLINTWNCLVLWAQEFGFWDGTWRFDTQCWMPFLAPLNHLSWLKNLCPNSILSCLGSQIIFVCMLYLALLDYTLLDYTTETKVEFVLCRQN
jgi:hypothetical protein